MNWNIFLAMPFAALLLGSPLHAPRLRAAIPKITDENCAYAKAVKMYLDAFAYSNSNPSAAKELLGAADNERQHCVADTSVLAARISGLKHTLFP